jgi:choline dehydrogenase
VKRTNSSLDLPNEGLLIDNQITRYLTIILTLPKNTSKHEMKRTIVFFAFLCTALATTNPLLLSWDYIVIGAGAGGSAIARGIIENSTYSVLILEKGPYKDCTVCDNSVQSPTDYPFSVNDPRYFTSSQLLGASFHDLRYSGAGGTTRIYGALSVPASKERIDQHYPNGSKYDDLKPYYMKTEDHYCHYLNTDISTEDCIANHGIGGPMEINPTHWESLSNVSRDIIAGAQAMGLSYYPDYAIPNRTQGIYKTQFFRNLAVRNDSNSTVSRANAWTNYLTPEVRGNPKLQISFGSRATKILFQNGTARSVVVQTDSAIYTVRAKKEIIIAAGVMESPKLLQLSGIGDPDILNQYGVPLIYNNPHVGVVRNHMAISVTYQTTITDGVNPLHNSGDSSLIFLRFDPLNTSPNAAPNIEIEVDDNTFIGPIRELVTGLPPYALPELPGIESGQGISYITFIITLTDADVYGSVSIASTNPNDIPIIDYGWNLDTFNPYTYEYAALSWAYDWVTNLTSSSNPWGAQYIVKEVYPGDYYNISGNPLGGFFEISQNETKRFTYFLYDLDPVYHMTGGCSMGDVVDVNGNVFGVSRLRVCDNSIQAGPPDANPTKTTLALCTKIVENILNTVPPGCAACA